MNRKTFFDEIKSNGLYEGSFTQPQVDGLNAVLDVLGVYEASLKEAAYDLATGYWETRGEFGATVENLNYTTTKRLREVWPSRFKTDDAAKPYLRNPQLLAEKVYGHRADLGNDRDGDGWRYAGKGIPQLTGRGRYRVMGDRLGVPLEDNPELMLQPNVSAAALVVGMREGLFTGKKLSDTLPDYKASRAVINGDVRANGAKLAEIADDFESALLKAGWGETPEEVDPAPEPVEEPTPAPGTVVPVPAQGIN